MRELFFQKHELIEKIDRSIKTMKISKKNSVDLKSFMDHLENNLSQYTALLHDLKKIKKFIPLSKRPEFSLSFRYSINLLSSIQIYFKKEDFVALNSLIEEEVPASINEWRRFVLSTRW